MKKSNTLMLSYMIFLALSLVAYWIFSWDGIDRISMAATIAGLFFAFADLMSWFISYNTSYCNSLKMMNQSMIDIYQKEIGDCGQQNNELESILEMLYPYVTKNKTVPMMIKQLKGQIETNNLNVKKYKDSVFECFEYDKEIVTNLEKNKIYQISEVVLMILGFVLFFNIVSFDSFVSILTQYQSVATIIAFFIIMLNYFLKDCIEENTKQRFDDKRKKSEELKLQLKQLNEELNKIDLTEKAKQFISEINNVNKKSAEGKTHGQTENAQPEQG